MSGVGEGGNIWKTLWCFPGQNEHFPGCSVHTYTYMKTTSISGQLCSNVALTE